MKNISKTKQKKRSTLDRIEKKYGIKFKYNTDDELYQSLEDSGVPSLVKLIKRKKK